MNQQGFLSMCLRSFVRKNVWPCFALLLSTFQGSWTRMFEYDLEEALTKDDTGRYNRDSAQKLVSGNIVYGGLGNNCGGNSGAGELLEI